MSIVKVVDKVRPDEIYNLAAQSHVQVSFDSPELTADVDADELQRTIRKMALNGDILSTASRKYRRYRLP